MGEKKRHTDLKKRKVYNTSKRKSEGLEEKSTYYDRRRRNLSKRGPENLAKTAVAQKTPKLPNG